MSVKSKTIYAVFGILTVCFVSQLPISGTGNALAFKPHHSHPRLRPGRVVARLPKAHVAVRVNRADFFFYSGVFYRRARNGYMVVTAPIGAVILRLPLGCSTIIVDGDTYYAYNGVYYRKGPAGYFVVSPPVSSQPQVSSGAQVTVTAQLLNVRSGPGMQFAIVRTTRQGEILTVNGTSPGWLYVRLSDGSYGWVSETFTVPAAPAAPAASG